MPAEIQLAGTDLCSGSRCHRLRGFAVAHWVRRSLIPSVGGGPQAVTGKTRRANGGRDRLASKWGCLGCATEPRVTFADAD